MDGMQVTGEAATHERVLALAEQAEALAAGKVRAIQSITGQTRILALNATIEAARAGEQATEADLIAHCRALMAGFKAPKRVVVTELPRTSTGKIQKHVLRGTLRLPA